MAETQAQGTDGGCTNSGEAAWEIVQLGDNRQQDKDGGPVKETKGGGVGLG